MNTVCRNCDAPLPPRGSLAPDWTDILCSYACKSAWRARIASGERRARLLEWKPATPAVTEAVRVALTAPPTPPTPLPASVLDDLGPATKTRLCSFCREPMTFRHAPGRPPKAHPACRRDAKRAVDRLRAAAKRATPADYEDRSTGDLGYAAAIVTREDYGYIAPAADAAEAPDLGLTTVRAARANGSGSVWPSDRHDRTATDLAARFIGRFAG